MFGYGSFKKIILFTAVLQSIVFAKDGLMPNGQSIEKLTTQNINVSSDINETVTSAKEPLPLYQNGATLKKVIETAISSNYRVKQYKERVLQAAHSAREAFADFLPQLTVSASAIKKKADGYEIQDYKQAQGDATLSYNLFSSGMHTASLQKALISKKEQEEKLKAVMEEEILKVIEAYFSVLYGRLSIEANKNNFEKLLQIEDIVKKKKEFGATTGGDEGSIVASVSNAHTALINTESAYNNAKDYYEFLTGYKPEALMPFETDFDVKLKAFDEIFDDIREYNSELSAIKTQIKGKQKEAFIARAADLPKVDFSFVKSRRYRDDFVDLTQVGNNRDSKLEITLSYNLYTGGRSEAKAARVMSEVSGLVFNLEYATKDIKWKTQKLLNSVHTNTRILNSIDSEIQANKKMVDAYWEKFKLSSQDLVTLLQAQRQLNAAELEKLRIEKTRVIDYFNLLSKSGKLLEYFGL